jgi:hypothetical protein
VEQLHRGSKILKRVWHSFNFFACDWHLDPTRQKGKKKKHTRRCSWPGRRSWLVARHMAGGRSWAEHVAGARGRRSARGSTRRSWAGLGAAVVVGVAQRRCGWERGGAWARCGGLGRGNAGRCERPDLRRSAGRCERPDLRRTHKELLPIPRQEAHDSTSDSLGHHRIRRFANGRAASLPAGERAPSAAGKRVPPGGHAATPPGRSGLRGPGGEVGARSRQQGSSGMGHRRRRGV